jgi:hypothetical protein
MKTLDGVAPSYFTQLYQTYLAKPTDENKNTLTYRIQNLFGALFQMGEIHLF